METAVIRKRLRTFKSAKGTLRNVSNEVVMEVLRGWEAWPGNSAEYYREIGLSKTQLATMIQKAKRLVKSGAVTESEFKEISLPTAGAVATGFDGVGMELRLDAIRAIRFSQVEQLVEFLKKTS
jgi:hypothetical protein